jgi:hypothetical protein
MTKLVGRSVAQVEWLDRDPLGGDPVPVARGVGDRAEPRHQRLERSRPVLLGAEQQADQVGGLRHRWEASRISRSVGR